MSAAIRLKQLQEQRGAKLKEASALSTAATKENRSLTSEELSKIEALQGEVDTIDRTITVEVRQVALESQAAQQKKADENRDAIQRFSMGRLVRQLAMGETVDGAEKEMIDEGAADARSAGIRSPKGVMIPLFATRQIQMREQEAELRSRFSGRELRDLTATTGTSLQYGGITVQNNVGTVYEALMNRLVLRNLGITVLEGLTGNLDLPRIVEVADPSHKGENVQADEHTPTFDKLTLNPRRLPTVIEVSNQLFLQSEAAIGTLVNNYAFRKLSVIMEKKWINGAGSGSSEPEGILGTSGIGSVIGGTNGAAPDWADIVGLEGEVAIDNADIGRLAYLTNAAVRKKLKSTAKVASSDSVMVWDDSVPNQWGYRREVTNSVPSNLVKGSSGSVCSAIIFGNWEDYIAGFWSGIEVLVNPYSKDDYGLTRLNFAVYYDGGVVRPVSFAAMQDALTS
jgi:HK97 family phage major capsid protein